MDFNLYNYARQAFDWLMPKKCILCQLDNANPHHPCCDECYILLPFQHCYCHKCGQAIGTIEDSCGRCLTSPPEYDSCFCPFEYKSPISDQIRAFKYNERPELAQSIAQLVCRELSEYSIAVSYTHLTLPTIRLV